MTSLTKSKFEYQRRLISECTENIQYITDSYNELPKDFDEYWEDSVIEFIDTPPDILPDVVDKIRVVAKKRVLKLIHQKNELNSQVNDVIDRIGSLPDSPDPIKTHSVPTSPTFETSASACGKSEETNNSTSAPATITTTPIDDNPIYRDVGDDDRFSYSSRNDGLGDYYTLHIFKKYSDKHECIERVKLALDCKNKSSGNLCYSLMNKICKYDGQTYYLWNEKTKLWIRENNINGVCMYASDLVSYICNDFVICLKQQMMGSNDPDFKAESELVIKKAKQLMSKWCDLNFMKACIQCFSPLATDVEFSRKLNKLYPYMLPIENGKLIDLETGKCLDREYDHMFSVECNAEYDPNVKSTIIGDYFRTIYGHDIGIYHYMIKDQGYRCLGTNPEKRINLHYGEIGNETKSTQNKLTNHFMPRFLSKEVNPKIFASSENESQNSHSGSIATLDGLRCATISEMKGDTPINETFLKNVSGGDEITGRNFNRGDEFDFISYTKLQLAGNFRFDLDSSDDALWSRLVPIIYKVVFTTPTERKRLYKNVPDEFIRFIDPTFEIRMKSPEAMSEYLNIVIEGARLYFMEGHHNPPESALKARDEYRNAVDILGTFINEACVKVESVNRSDFVKTSTFHNDYNHWRQANGHTKESSRKVGTQMKKKGYPSVKTGTTYYEGINIESSQFQNI